MKTAHSSTVKILGEWVVEQYMLPMDMLRIQHLLIVPLMILGEQYVGNTKIEAKYIIQNSLTAVQIMVEQHILEHIMTTTHLSIADLIIMEGHCTGMPTKAPHHIGKTII